MEYMYSLFSSTACRMARCEFVISNRSFYHFLTSASQGNSEPKLEKRTERTNARRLEARGARLPVAQVSPSHLPPCLLPLRPRLLQARTQSSGAAALPAVEGPLPPLLLPAGRSLPSPERPTSRRAESPPPPERPISPHTLAFLRRPLSLTTV